jgi:hypothetical protein
MTERSGRIDVRLRVHCTREMAVQVRALRHLAQEQDRVRRAVADRLEVAVCRVLGCCARRPPVRTRGRSGQRLRTAGCQADKHGSAQCQACDRPVRNITSAVVIHYHAVAPSRL